MTGTTGHPCPESGLWTTVHGGCREQIALSKTNIFPPCPHCRGAATWVLTQKTQKF